MTFLYQLVLLVSPRNWSGCMVCIPKTWPLFAINSHSHCIAMKEESKCHGPPKKLTTYFLPILGTRLSPIQIRKRGDIFSTLSYLLMDIWRSFWIPNQWSKLFAGRIFVYLFDLSSPKVIACLNFYPILNLFLSTFVRIKNRKKHSQQVNHLWDLISWLLVNSIIMIEFENMSSWPSRNPLPTHNFDHSIYIGLLRPEKVHIYEWVNQMNVTYSDNPINMARWGLQVRPPSRLYICKTFSLPFLASFFGRKNFFSLIFLSPISMSS